MAAISSDDLADLDLAPALRAVRSAGASVAGSAVDAAKDATYTFIGLGVLAYQRAQVRRREFERAVRDT